MKKSKQTESETAISSLLIAILNGEDLHSLGNELVLLLVLGDEEIGLLVLVLLPVLVLIEVIRNLGGVLLLTLNDLQNLDGIHLAQVLVRHTRQLVIIENIHQEFNDLVIQRLANHLGALVLEEQTHGLQTRSESNSIPPSHKEYRREES